MNDLKLQIYVDKLKIWFRAKFQNPVRCKPAEFVNFAPINDTPLIMYVIIESVL